MVGTGRLASFHVGVHNNPYNESRDGHQGRLRMGAYVHSDQAKVILTTTNCYPKG